MLYSEKLVGFFQDLKCMEEKYALDASKTIKTIEDMKSFRVTLPVIGNFSTGKSSMLNAILEKELLPVDITPETAVPTEIHFGDNKVYRRREGSVTESSIEELPLRGLSIQNTDVVRIEYNHPFLEEVSSVMLVDLPGFDTNISLHNKALEEYLPNSLAFLLVVSSDEPVLKNYVEDFLKILKFHDMPIYVVLTKTARLSDSELEECKALLQKTVANIFNLEEVKIACVESYGKVRTGEVKEFLLEINADTESIFERKYMELLKRSSRTLEGYLEERLDVKDLNTSQLEEKREVIKKNIGKLLNKVENEQKLFDEQTDTCIQVVKEKVGFDLQQASGALAVYLENKIDINEKINGIIQNTVIESVMKEFEPRLQKYLKDIHEIVKFDTVWDEKMNLDVKAVVSDNKVTNLLVKLAPLALAGLGAIIAPPIAALGVVLGLSADTVYNITSVKSRHKKSQEAAEQIVTQVTKQVGENIEQELKNYVHNVNEMIKKEIEHQNVVLEKALNDVEQLLELEEDARQRDLQGIKEDLERVRGFIYTE